jgi:adenylate kinase
MLKNDNYFQSNIFLNKNKFPYKFIWLNGPPGSGKSTHSNFILNIFSSKNKPIIVSNLLKTKKAKLLKDKGLLINSKEVNESLFKKLLNIKNPNQYVLIDGYPRTINQAKFLIFLYKTLKNKKFMKSNIAARVKFIIIFLDLEKKISINRQIQRGKDSLNLLKKTIAKNGNSKINIRKTDFSIEIASNRFKIFKQKIVPVTNFLSNFFHCYKFNANKNINEIENSIFNRFKK